MAGKDYIPKTDGDFEIWQDNFVAKIVANPAAYGLLPVDVVDLETDSADWLRRIIKRIQARKATTDAQG